jgi:hypothetical protein
MTDFANNHEPTPEFRASLEREIARAFRSEVQFGAARRASHLRRFGMVVGLAMGAVIMLTVGLVLGVNTRYASAEGLDTRRRDESRHSPLDLLRAMPVRNAIAALTCGTPTPNPIPAPKVAAIQKTIPLVDLPAASVRAPESFGGIIGLRQMADGKVLVNDAGRRQLKLFDSTLATATTVLDSTPGSSNSYGPIRAPLLPFLGDSSLFVDWNAQTLVVLDERGKVARGFALPQLRDFRSATNPATGVDAKGRLVFRAIRAPQQRASAPGMEYPDSIAIVRADLDARRVDTITRFARPLMKITTEKYSDGSSGIVYAVDPLQPVDEWAVLSNGAVAIVRGHDYHIDWIQPDGSMTSTAKIPFDAKHFTDEEKQRRADSLRTAQSSLLAIGYPLAEVRLRFPMPCDAGRGGAGSAGRGGGSGRSGNDGAPPPAGDCTMMTTGDYGGRGGPPLPSFVDLMRAGPVADYESPLRSGGTVADQDGNLWVLPQRTTLAEHGELVYDVINSKGELFQRVRLPAGRAIAGFGKGGVVFLTSGDRTSGFYLERTTLPGAQSAKSPDRHAAGRVPHSK